MAIVYDPVGGYIRFRSTKDLTTGVSMLSIPVANPSSGILMGNQLLISPDPPLLTSPNPVVSLITGATNFQISGNNTGHLGS